MRISRRTHRPFGIVGVGDRRAKYGHDRIADVFVNRPAIALHNSVYRFEVMVEDVMNLFGVEFARKLRESRQVQKRHRDLAPLSRRESFARLIGFVVCSLGPFTAQSALQLPARSKRDADFLQVTFAERSQNGEIDLMINERLVEQRETNRLQEAAKIAHATL